TSDGSAMTDVVISLAATDDGFVGANEDFKVVLATAGSGSGDVTLGSSDQVTTTITSADASEWSITGSDTVAEGDSASYTVSLSGNMQGGETATIDLGITNIDTTSADYASFVDAVNAAILGRPELGFDGTTLTFTSDGSAMTDVVISLAATDDGFVEANEDFKVVLTNAGSSSGGCVTLGSSDQVTTTITSADASE